ncbi:asparagine synthase (glutamine-hydrolyzing) [Amycolatopsis sp. NPDC054798]
MCGLAGIASIGRDLPPDAGAVLTSMARAVAHRGPDGEQLFLDGPVALGFRRLALVGPSSGDQPLFSDDKQTVLIANGEVYNHRELEARMPDVRMRTKSDCEVLAHLYARHGMSFLDDVCGMYAIALWDRGRNRLVFARDRFGIKPLYFTVAGGQVVFGSEIKALFQHPACRRELDWERSLADQSMNIGAYLTDEPPSTWFRDIELVPAGGMVAIDLATGRVERSQYWQLPDFDGDEDASDAELITRYRELLEASVADCASADAELGLFLSGGVDSAAVAALAARRDGPEIHTFTVLGASTFLNGDGGAAHDAAAALGIPNHQLVFDVGRTPGVDQWKQLLWLLETPLCNAEQYFKYELYRYAKQLRPELRGMLLGQASDEYNGGYSPVLSGDTDWAGFEAGLRQMARTSALRERPALAPWWPDGQSSLVHDDLLRGTALRDPYRAYVAWKHRHIQQYNCWHEDRTAAGNGVEARVPFLDHRIIELLGRLPAKRRASLLWDKRILRDAVRDVLPPAIADREKVSFFYGEGEGYTHRMMVRMLARDGDALLEEALAAPGAAGILRPDRAREALRGLEKDLTPFDVEYLLRLVNLGLLDQMTRSMPALPVDAPRYEILPVADEADWEDDGARLAARLRRVPAPQPDEAVEFGEDVLLVHAPDDPSTLYLAVDGRFEYVVDADEAPEWWAFLRGIDAQRTVAEIVAAAGLQYDDVHETLRDALDAGLLVLVPARTPAVAR